MLRAAICQTLFCQNVVSKNSSNFNNDKVSQYTVHCQQNEWNLLWIRYIYLLVNMCIIGTSLRKPHHVRSKVKSVFLLACL